MPGKAIGRGGAAPMGVHSGCEKAAGRGGGVAGIEIGGGGGMSGGGGGAAGANAMGGGGTACAGVGGRGKGALETCAGAATAAPHPVQNFRPLFNSAPHPEHLRSSLGGTVAPGEVMGVPQLVQNFMLGGFSPPHFTQIAILIPPFPFEKLLATYLSAAAIASNTIAPPSTIHNVPPDAFRSSTAFSGLAGS